MTSYRSKLTRAGNSCVELRHDRHRAAGLLASATARKPARPNYAHVHWYMLAALSVVLLGFWPTFYQPRTSGTTLRNVHGVTSTLWYAALVVQPWLVTNGYVRWHRRVAVVVIALLPIVTVTALMNTRVMLTRGALPPIARPLVAYLDVTLVALFVVLFLLGLRNRKRRRRTSGTWSLRRSSDFRRRLPASSHASLASTRSWRSTSVSLSSSSF